MTITTTTPATAHVTLGQIDSITDAIAAKEATKVDKVAGKGLSEADYTNTEKTKLQGVAEGAQVNVLEAVKVNGEALEITEKGVNIDLSEYAKSADYTTALLYKGTVATYAELPAEGQKVGDMYNVTAADPSHDLNAGENVAWNGTSWDNLGGVTDLSGKVDKEDGKGLSTEDFTTDLKTKLEAINEATAEDINQIVAKFASAASGDLGLQGWQVFLLNGAGWPCNLLEVTKSNGTDWICQQNCPGTGGRQHKGLC